MRTVRERAVAQAARRVSHEHHDAVLFDLDGVLTSISALPREQAERPAWRGRRGVAGSALAGDGRLLLPVAARRSTNARRY